MSDIPQDKYTNVNGLNFNYRDWGGSGQPIVMIHGLASNARIWDFVAPNLAKEFAVVALNQRGHGESDKPDSGYDFDTVASDLYGFIANLGIEKPIIVGHSWGGDVALEFALKNPDVAKGLCFVDGGTIEISSRPENTLEQAKIDMAPPVWTGMTAQKLVERARTWRSGDMTTEKHLEILLANFQELEDGTITARLSRDNHLKIIEAFWEHKPSELYSRVKVPVLLMPARQKNEDSLATRRWNKEKSIEIASERLPISKTVWMEDSIHDVPLQRPELVANTIREHIDNGFFG